MNKDAGIFVAGHSGLAGSAVSRVLRKHGFTNVILRDHHDLDLTDQSVVEQFFHDHRPEYVFLLAGLAGGIKRNKTIPAEMIYVNLAIQTNVIHAAYLYGAKKLLFPGSACSYPKQCPMPISPEAIMTGPLEPTNEPFAVAKIAGMCMCRSYNSQCGTHFISVIPATMYGPNDHFDENGHVVASLIARCHAARTSGADEMVVWGTGNPRREFLYVDDAAEAMLMLMRDYDGSEIIHIGAGEDISIADLAGKIAEVVGFTGRIVFDTTKPDGMPRRLLDSGRIAEMGWRSTTSLAEGLKATYLWYQQNVLAGVR